MVPKLLTAAFVAGLVMGSSISRGQAAVRPSSQIPLTNERWNIAPTDSRAGAKPDVSFITKEGFAGGVAIVRSGSIHLKAGQFSNGTIEYDFKGIGEDMPGIRFREQGLENTESAEEFYVRTSPDCRASNDCIQYAPVINGFMLWNLYPQYQARAPVLDGWNHIKLVISGRRMSVYVNGCVEPAIRSAELQSSSMQGGISFVGPAFFANLVVAPQLHPLRSSGRSGTRVEERQGMVTHWRLGPLTRFDPKQGIAYSQKPGHDVNWKLVHADKSGMVNLNRIFTYKPDPPPVSWLKAEIQSDRDGRRQIALGWLGRIWVFVNGRPAVAANNIYYSDRDRRPPDGRMSLDNGTFDLPLKRGSNQIVVALVSTIHSDGTPNRYGWGMMLRIDNARGLAF